MIYFILIFTILTLCLTIFVINFCLKYITNLRQNYEQKIEKLIIQNNVDINSLHKYFDKTISEKEEDFVKKLRMLSRNDDMRMLSDDNNSMDLLEFYVIENRITRDINSYSSSKAEYYRSEKMFFQYNFLHLSIEQIEQMLINNLAKYLFENNFVRGKYQIRDNMVKFYCKMYNKV